MSIHSVSIFHNLFFISFELSAFYGTKTQELSLNDAKYFFPFEKYGQPKFQNLYMFFDFKFLDVIVEANCMIIISNTNVVI